MKKTLNHLSPYVRYGRLNISPALTRSFIDPEYVFTYIKSGRGIYVVEGMEYQVKAGDMILMAPYMLHATKSDSGHEMVQCVLHFDLFYDEARTGIIRLAPGMDYKLFSTDDNNPETLLINAPLLRSNVPEAVQGQIFRRYESIAASFRDHDRKFRLWHERAAILEILALYLQQPHAATENTERDEKWRNVEKALTYIHTHYAESLKLPDISRKAGISMNYFCQVFKQHTGQSIHRYLNELRVYQAKRLIEDSELSMTEIAAATGLGDLHAFSKIFKKYERATPTEYRRRSRADGESPHVVSTPSRSS